MGRRSPRSRLLETQKGVLWVGTNDGKVWISRDAGANWTDLTKNVNMPPWGIVRRIDASHFDPATAYMAVDYHLVDDRDPYFYKTSDFGKTWTRIDGGLPKGHPLDYALSIAENPHRRGMLFAGTGHAFFYSRDDGRSWTQFKGGLPAAPVNWIEVPRNAPDVAVATYGRGLWILRDVTLPSSDEDLAASSRMQRDVVKAIDEYSLAGSLVALEGKTQRHRGPRRATEFLWFSEPKELCGPLGFTLRLHVQLPGY